MAESSRSSLRSRGICHSSGCAARDREEAGPGYNTTQGYNNPLGKISGMARRLAADPAKFARMLGTAVAVGAKQRFGEDRVSIDTIIGEVANRDVIVLDDEIAKGSTVLELIHRLRERSTRSIRIGCTHGIFSSGALERLNRQPDVLEIVCTNTVPIPVEKRVEKLRVLSVASAIAEAMRRIHNGESVSAPFEPT